MAELETRLLIGAASEAARDWGRTPAVDRGKMLHEVAPPHGA